LATFEDWIRTLDQGYGVDVIYLDYSKVFDSVPHQRLLCKLEAYGIRGNLLSWLSNFLSNHLESVTINGCLSEWTNVQSGVPQGSVLGPLLYVNDIPDLIKGGVRMFADDTKIYFVIRNFDDCLRLQSDLNQLSQWSTVWLLRFNAAKCKVMWIGYFPATTYTMTDTFTNSSVVLEEVNILVFGVLIL